MKYNEAVKKIKINVMLVSFMKEYKRKGLTKIYLKYVTETSLDPLEIAKELNFEFDEEFLDLIIRTYGNEDVINDYFAPRSYYMNLEQETPGYYFNGRLLPKIIFEEREKDMLLCGQRIDYCDICTRISK